MSKSEEPEALPEVRFPEFSDHPAWAKPKLAEKSQRITDKVGNSKLPTVSITAGVGFVSQEEKFGRDISGQQYKNYVKLQRGDFSYNKGNSKTFPQGAIYQLKEFDAVAAPNAFLSFALNDDVVPEFYEGYFEQNYHGRQLLRYITSGARSDGLLNINPDDFFSIILPTPLLAEQIKLGSCFSSLNDLIRYEEHSLSALVDHKKGMLQVLFPTDGKSRPERRMPGFDNAEAWQEIELADLGDTVTGLTYAPDDIREEGLLVLRSSNVQDQRITLDDNVFVRDDIEGANLSQKNDILICVRNGSRRLIGKTALIPAGLPRSTHGAFMSVFRAARPKFVFQLFQTQAFHRQVLGDLGATINSINTKNLKKYRFYVPDSKEQEVIAEFLEEIDVLIDQQSQRLEDLRKHKSGLLQGLLPSIEAVEI